MLQVEKYRNICEIIIVGKEHDVKATQESQESMPDAINLALDHVKRQAQKNRKTIRDHHRKDGNRNKAEGVVTEWAVNVLEPGHLRVEGDHNRPRIIKTNNLPIRPMSIEEAALRLDDSKNEFIVFRDLDTDKVSVMYKRRDNNLGLIAPEF
jgi:putative sigma-54 modulation protein